MANMELSPIDKIRLTDMSLTDIVRMPQDTLDRDRLHDAVNMCTAEKLYTWSSMLKSPPQLGSIGIHNIMELKLPLDVEDVEKLCNHLKCPLTPLDSGPIVIEAKELYEPESTQGSWNQVLRELSTRAVSEMLNFNSQTFGCRVHAVLRNLVICQGNMIYRGQLNFDKEPGTFGSLILQVPINGVVGGSSIKVQYSQENIWMRYSLNSETNYFVTSVAGKRINNPNVVQEFAIEAANGHHCVLLIANLIWEDVVDSLPSVEADRFPQFVEAAYQTNQALNGWRYLVHNSNDEPIRINRNAVNPSGHFFIESPYEERLPLLDASQTKALCVPLKRNYCLDNYNLSCLKGDDALIGRVLTSQNYLTVDLVLIKKMTFPTTDWRENALLKTEEKVEVFKPFTKDLADLMPLLLTTGENFTGNLTFGISCPRFGPKECTFCTENQQCRVLYGAFLIQPKSSRNATVKSSKSVLNTLINQPSDAKGFEEALAMVNGLSSRNVRVRIIDMFKAIGWLHWKESLFFKILIDTHISRSFHGVMQLALECQTSNCKEGLVTVSLTAIDMFTNSVTKGGANDALPHLIDLLGYAETINASQTNFLLPIQQALKRLTGAHLASIIVQNKSAANAKYLAVVGRVLLEKGFQDVTPAQMFRIVESFLDLKDIEIVNCFWKRVCEDASTKCGPSLLQYMMMFPKTNAGRVALVTHMASFSQFTREALHVVVRKLEANSADMTADALSEILLCFASAETNELLASEARMKHFFAFLLRIDLEILCQLPKKLRKNSWDEEIIRTTRKEVFCGFEVAKMLIVTLIKERFKEILNLKIKDVVVEFVDNIFSFFRFLRNVELVNLFLSKVILFDSRAAVCFQSKSFNFYIMDLLDGKRKIGEEKLIPLMKLWFPNALEFNKKYGLTVSTLIKAFSRFFPRYDEGGSLSRDFTKLLSSTRPNVLFHFLKNVYEKKMSDLTEEEELTYRNILLAAIEKLIEEREFLGMEPLDKIPVMLKIALWMGYDPVVSSLTSFVAAIKSTSMRLVVEEVQHTSSSAYEQIVDEDVSWPNRAISLRGNKTLERFLLFKSKSKVNLLDARLFHYYVIGLLDGAGKIEEKSFKSLIKLWIRNALEFKKTYGLSGLTLSMAFLRCFPRYEDDRSLIRDFKKLLSSTRSSALIDFLEIVCYNRTALTKEDKLAYLKVLPAAIEKLIEEREFFSSIPLDKKLSMLKVVLLVGYDPVVSSLVSFVASTQGISKRSVVHPAPMEELCVEMNDFQS